MSNTLAELLSEMEERVEQMDESLETVTSQMILKLIDCLRRALEQRNQFISECFEEWFEEKIKVQDSQLLAILRGTP